MSISIYQYVLRLQVAVCDAFSFVQKLQDEHNLSGVELRSGFVEAARSSEIAKDFAAGAVVELSITCQPVAMNRSEEGVTWRTTM